MNGKDFLLDTNIVIALLNKDELLLEKIILESQIFIPTIAIGELIYGAYNSNNVASNIAAIERICNIFQVVNCTSETAGYYGLIKKQLKDKGKPIPENNIWTTALAAENHLVVVTRDKHFENIELIQKTDWLA